MIAVGFIIIGLSIFLGLKYAADRNAEFHVKPRVAFAQVGVIGTTEQSEQMQITVTLFDDEPEIVWDSKVKKALKIREARLHEQNLRMLELQKESIKMAEDAKAEAERLGVPTKVTPINQGKK